MKKVFTAKDIAELKRSGGALPPDAILTPQAKEALSGGAKISSSAPAPKSAAVSAVGRKEYKIPEKEYKWKPGGDPKTPQELEKFFFSPQIQALKKLIVDLGRRSYGKNYNDGNGGNFSVRVGDNLVLCTPTMISKGSMSVDDMCLVDLDATSLPETASARAKFSRTLR